MLKVEAGAQTDVGLVRRSNQDSFGSDERFGLYVVCDGMGGAAAGDVASHLATETFLAIARQELERLGAQNTEASRHALRRAAVAANRAVVEHAWFNPKFRGMGSTLVAARLAGEAVTLVNVGDSRAYLVRERSIQQLTRDHSYVAEQVRLGLMTEAEAETSSMQSVITRAIGADGDVHPDLYDVTLQPGDTLLLTSDGLTRHVQEAELAGLIADTVAQPPEETCRQLIALAKERGGSDNITCFVLHMV